MSWRMHIAVVDTDKAQKIRVLPAEHYNKMAEDWIKVQKIACDYCKKNARDGYINYDFIEFIEDELKSNNLSYSREKLAAFIRYIADSPFEVDKSFEVEFTDFNQFIEKDMGVIEDYCLGRFDDISKTIGNPFYTHEDTQKLFEYYNPRVIYKQDFEKIVELFRKLIVENYKEILMDPSKELRWRGHLESKLECWQSPYIEPYNMDDHRKEIVRDYSLEYRIFELVRLYKSIDWTRNTVVFFGW